MDSVWEKMHSSQSWGKYPATDLIRSVKRSLRQNEKSEAQYSDLRVLEVGCGAGANLSFFINEGFDTHGLDGSPSAIKNAHMYLKSIHANFNSENIIQGDFTNLPYNDAYFDIVVDYLAIYTGKYSQIQSAFSEVNRVLKPGGLFYSRSWAQGCEGHDTGVMLESGTSENPLSGPCEAMGVSHFFTESELYELSDFCSVRSLRKITDHDCTSNTDTVEWALCAKK